MSNITEFILLGLTQNPGLQTLFFAVFLIIYLITLEGNLLISVTVFTSPALGSPMYYFLSYLSMIDAFYSSSIAPKLIFDLVSGKNTISFSGCMTQVFAEHFFAGAEIVLLAVMAYDRYVAICKPLLYNTAMSPKVCSSLMLGSYLMAFSGAMAHTGCMLRLTFCDANTINHYFCDILPLLELSCTSTYVSELEVFIVGGINIIVPSLTIFVSYGLILTNILHISSTEGRSKAFSTCSSHIIAVSLFFGSGAFMDLKPPSAVSMDEGKISSVFYTNMIPMMNPLIYSLRNKDVKLALRKALSRRQF